MFFPYVLIFCGANYGTLELSDVSIITINTKRRIDRSRKVGYLDAVEKVSAETVVVVCIYDDRVRYNYLRLCAFGCPRKETR